MQDDWEQHYQNQVFFELEPHSYLPAFAKKCKQREIGRVLDLGCGAGQDILFLAQQDLQVEGVDFSPSAAANAEDLLQSKGLPGKVYVDNLFDKVTTFEQDAYPAVIAINALEYTDHKTFAATIEEVSRILSPGGLFLIIVPSEKAKLADKEREQLFFTEEKLSQIVQKQFAILDYFTDNQENIGMLLENN